MISTTRFVAFLAICACCLVQFTKGQVTSDGPCPSVSVANNFDISKYIGLWYEVAKYPAVFETGGKCITANYELLDNGTVGVLNSQYNVIEQKPIEINGNAVVIENAKLLVQFPGQPTPTGSNYWVLGTDYTNYSVVFSCSESESAPGVHKKILWILTRDREPSMDTAINALVVVTSNKLPLDYLTITNQDECEENTV